MNLQSKNENYILNRKMKKDASSGEKKSGPQPLNNSLASFRHQRGRNSTDPRPANACTNSCGQLNSTQLYTEKLSYCFAGWHCWNGVKKTKDTEQSTVELHGKEMWTVRGVGGGGRGVGAEVL